MKMIRVREGGRRERNKCRGEGGKVEGREREKEKRGGEKEGRE